jgi:hypothetical protein
MFNISWPFMNYIFKKSSTALAFIVSIVLVMVSSGCYAPVNENTNSAHQRSPEKQTKFQQQLASTMFFDSDDEAFASLDISMFADLSDKDEAILANARNAQVSASELLADVNPRSLNYPDILFSESEMAEPLPMPPLKGTSTMSATDIATRDFVVVLPYHIYKTSVFSKFLLANQSHLNAYERLLQTYLAQPRTTKISQQQLHYLSVLADVTRARLWHATINAHHEILAWRLDAILTQIKFYQYVMNQTTSPELKFFAHTQLTEDFKTLGALFSDRFGMNMAALYIDRLRTVLTAGYY